MTIVETAALESHKLFRGLGAEPLSRQFDAEYLKEALRNKETPIKSALLDQRVIAGMGNIYVCEALWRSRISPKRQAARVKAVQIDVLAPAIKQVLREAVRAGGSSLRDHMQTNGELGYFQKEFAAYDREGQPCMRRGCHGRDQTHRTKRTFNILLSNMPGLLNELTIRATDVILRGDDFPIWNGPKTPIGGLRVLRPLG